MASVTEKHATEAAIYCKATHAVCWQHLHEVLRVKRDIEIIQCLLAGSEQIVTNADLDLELHPNGLLN